jgi:hypothetical protein
VGFFPIAHGRRHGGFEEVTLGDQPHECSLVHDGEVTELSGSHTLLHHLQMIIPVHHLNVC